MVIASIDIQDGKVVQLKQGVEKVIERHNAPELAREFDIYGETAVIDLDAAMRKSSNIDMVKKLLPLARCRVGGGIRTAEQAVEMVSLGAEKIIIGSAAFRTDGKFGVNTAFLEELVQKIGRERIIIAIDSRNGVITIDGWKTSTGLDLINTAQQTEKYAAELLWTCVEREGMLSGINLDAASTLRNAVSCRITVAGGVSTLDEIGTLARTGCDVQLGMALYTGKISLADAFIESLNWRKAITIKSEDGFESPPLLPIIAQSPDGQILMTGYTNREALTETFKRRNLCFYSRTRRKLWMKGETSGHTLQLLRLRADCDRDALLAIVNPDGSVCHTGDWSCFETSRRMTFQYLQEIIETRLKTAPEGSYTASLSIDKVKRKVMEEAYEICTARNREETVWEAADLFFHVLLLMSKHGISVDEALNELARRHKENPGKKKRFGE
ncbi:MAG: bifunctional phosphoribosyl-AMP cyclohydrolase/phosphoribosyl-ATP diphosphatase HisIE [Spirochaetaceae bacterium]|jgi:phosphoribosyl-ATP pyrophosphohydrolase/phosphoribosyl-AMP cyclohydrolase|nr:bifunctional phosphoribosyl-AMP cyclohydrolase/phosphoribosyl-ATP diphosphatase HisIE [Spirochaetaceae bacterium]